MNVVEIVKGVGDLVGGLSASYTVNTALNMLKPSELTKIGKVAWSIGACTLGGIAGVMAQKHVEEEIDAIKEAFDIFRGKEPEAE